jgi:hypothetical protein
MDFHKEFIDVLMKQKRQRQSDIKGLSSDNGRVDTGVVGAEPLVKPLLGGVDTGVDTGVVGAEPLAEHLVKPHMKYNEVETMAFHLSLQLQVLEEKGYSLLFLQASDVVILDEQLYLLSNLEQLVPLNKKDIKQIVLNYPTCYPFPKEVCAPEVLKMSALPFVCSKSACYYSLGLLCLKVLHMSLEDLRGSKLFYFLERCLKDEPKERWLTFM